MNTNDLHLLALSMVPQLGPKRCRILLKIFREARNVFEASRRDLSRISFVTSDMINKLKSNKLLVEAEDIRSAALQKGMELWGFTHPSYPDRLHHIPHPPVILYADCSVDVNRSRMIAVVGTRKPTDHGIWKTEELIRGLAHANVTILSGLAFGIDACAHKSAVKSGLPTIAVLGGALDKIYPAQHKKLYESMRNNGGGISEFPPGIKAEREHFPMRNRILAGMADVVIVVESGVKGGSMITARMANDYNREVGAMPGIIGKKQISGCHYLIKNNEAHLIENAADVLALMQWNDDTSEEKITMSLPADERTKEIYLGLRSSGPLQLDQVLSKFGLSSADWSGIALKLELSGHIRILPGNVIKAM